MNFMCNLKGDLADRKPSYRHSLDTIIYGDEYQNETLFENDACILTSTKYEHYPLTFFENEEFRICLEGMIYGVEESSLRAQLYSLAATLFGNEEDAKNILRDWLLNADGEFIVFMQQKSSDRIVIFNDCLARLPFYYFRSENELIFSRDVRFIANITGSREFDRMAIAQFLLISYPLGKRTFFKDVNRLDAASFIRIDANRSCVDMDVVYKFNFDHKKYRFRTVSANARKLAPLFADGVKNRVKPDFKTILSLSGGLDSRTVGSALKYNNITFNATTWLDSHKKKFLDAETAEQMAGVLGVDWKLFQIDPALGADSLKVLRMKSGLVYLGLPHILKYLRSIREQYGSQVIYMSGNGGDRIARYIRPNVRMKWKLRNLDDLAGAVIREGCGGGHPGYLLLDDVAALTRIPKDEIIAEFKDHLATYPEKKMVQKYVHYNIYAQCFKWHHEGDDRNRFYFWSTPPFWSIHFFKYIMNCPDRQKKNAFLYTKFMSLLCPEASEVDYAPNAAAESVSIADRKYLSTHVKRFLRGLPNPVRMVGKRVKRLMGVEPAKPAKRPEPPNTFSHNPDLMKCLRDQLNNCSEIDEYLSHGMLADIVKDSDRYAFRTMADIFTMTSMIEDYKCAKSSIEDYLGSDLGSHR